MYIYMYIHSSTPLNPPPSTHQSGALLMEESLRRELEPALAAEKGKRRPSYGMVYDGDRQVVGEEEDDAVRGVLGLIYYVWSCLCGRVDILLIYYFPQLPSPPNDRNRWAAPTPPGVPAGAGMTTTTTTMTSAWTTTAGLRRGLRRRPCPWCVRVWLLWLMDARAVWVAHTYPHMHANNRRRRGPLSPVRWRCLRDRRSRGRAGSCAAATSSSSSRRRSSR